MEHREISVDNIDVQGQLKIKEEVSTSVKVDESPGQSGIYPRLPREESNAQYNYSFNAMERGQGEISPLQGQEEYSVNAEGRMTEAAPVQSEQDSTEDKEKDMEDREISVDNSDVEEQFEIKKEEVLASINVEKSPGPDGIHPRLLREENNSGNNYSFGTIEQGQSEFSTLQERVIKEEFSVNDEERPTDAPGQSEQDYTEDKENHAPSKRRDEVTEGEQSSTSTLQGQNGNSENCEGRTSGTVQDQSEQVSTEDKEKKYELFAVWHHRGSYGGGHYIAEIKSGSGDWYSFDDRFVKKIGKNINLRSTTAYMVMYRLVDTNKETGSDATTPEQCQTQNPYPEYQNCNELAENYFYI